MTENTPEEQLRLIDILAEKYAAALQDQNSKYQASEQATHELYAAEDQTRLLRKELDAAQADLVELKINQ